MIFAVCLLACICSAPKLECLNPINVPKSYACEAYSVDFNCIKEVVRALAESDEYIPGIRFQRLGNTRQIIVWGGPINGAVHYAVFSPNGELIKSGKAAASSRTRFDESGVVVWWSADERAYIFRGGARLAVKETQFIPTVDVDQTGTLYAISKGRNTTEIGFTCAPGERVAKFSLDFHKLYSQDQDGDGDIDTAYLFGRDIDESPCCMIISVGENGLDEIDLRRISCYKGMLSEGSRWVIDFLPDAGIALLSDCKFEFPVLWRLNRWYLYDLESGDCYSTKWRSGDGLLLPLH